MSDDHVKKPRREKGTGSVYRPKGSKIWWIAYRHPDGSRKTESSGTRIKTDAAGLLRRRTGARDHGLLVIPGVEKTTFEDGGKAVLDDFANTGKKSGDEVERRIRLHLQPFFGGRRLISIMADDIRRYVTERK